MTVNAWSGMPDQPASLPAEVADEQIDAVWNEHKRSLVLGDVHVFARAILALATPIAAQPAAADAVAQLRHLYANLMNGAVRDTASAKRIATGLLGPVIERLEALAAPAQPAPEPAATVSLQAEPVINGKPATARSILDALIDIHDDGQNNPEEHRCYVPEAWRDILAEARAYLATHPQPAADAGEVERGWQPIATAPKDRIFLLGLPIAGNLREGDRRVYEGRWHEGEQTFTSVNGFVLLSGATHWMPLPAAPSAALAPQSPGVSDQGEA